jgi:hypothetical protein
MEANDLATHLFTSVDDFVRLMASHQDQYHKQGYELEGEAYRGEQIHDHFGGALEVWHCTLRFIRAGNYSAASQSAP